jgi:hypothetical protein
MDAGVSHVRAAYDGGTPQLRARFYSRLRSLAHLPFAEWNENYHKHLKGDSAGLEELRFIADNVQQRPLGFRSGDTEFTLLYWATEKGNKFQPLSACRTALECKKKILANRDLSDVLWLDLE